VIRVDRDRKRVSLSLRQTGGDPWERIEERYTLGQLITGRVTRIVSYGAFIEVEPGVEGLVHISELSEDKPGSAKDVIEEGEVLPLRVVRIDATRRRLGLSFRRVTEQEWAEWRASRLHTEEEPESAAVEPSATEAAEEVAAAAEAGEEVALPEEAAVVEEAPAPATAPEEAAAVEEAPTEGSTTMEAPPLEAPVEGAEASEAPLAEEPAKAPKARRTSKKKEG